MPLGGRTLIERVLGWLATEHIGQVVLNLHNLPESICAVVGDGAHLSLSVKYSWESPLLGSSGGPRHALPLIDAEPFLAVNSDNLWIDGPVDTLRLMASSWDDEKMDALLLLVPLARANCHTGQGDFHMSATGALRRKKRGTVAPFVYTGVQMVSRRLCEGELPSGPFSANLLWDRAIESGRCFGVVHQGLWFDGGTPVNVKKTEELLSNV